MERHAYLFAGQVQGVGFRPFVYRTAARLGLTGFVGNTSDGVRVEVQGKTDALAAFGHALHSELPPLARISQERFATLPPLADEASFCIVASQGHSGHSVLVSPDVATCQACLADLRDPANRRHAYAFTNCTDCGPRYTITRSIPYDRATTTMACFPLCPACQAEYEDPLNRRFHAQPNACPVCGPSVWFVAPGEYEGAGSALTDAPPDRRDSAAVFRAATLLAAGGIVAVKGLGGFLLACDASNPQAVAELRRRKGRPHKALAIMPPDLENARGLALLRPEEEALLQSPERPVVVVRKRENQTENQTGNEAESGKGLAPNIAPDLDSVGIMLPYTPLHYLLLEAFCQAATPKGRKGERGPFALVMTSGNAGGEPISLGNREALERLSGIADAFLLHNRDILIRADDSVLRLLRPLPPKLASQQNAEATGKMVGKMVGEKVGEKVGMAAGLAPELQFFRRARGYVPRPVALTPLAVPCSGSEASPCILATGAELKSTLCFTRGDQAFVSQHIGDLGNAETAAFFEETAEHLAGLLEVRPSAVVRDLHPDYASSAFAEAYGAARGLPVLRLQHHFAHIYAVLAEHGYSGPALGLALDGTGLGEDGSIWGGELLYVHPEAVSRAAPSPGKRLGRLSPFPLPGGDAAVREPWRLVSAFWGLLGEALEAHGESGKSEKIGPGSFMPGENFVPPGREATHAAIVELVRKQGAAPGLMPQSSSCGRLFDAVAALLGLLGPSGAISYEGQAAIRLEEAQDRSLSDLGTLGRTCPGAPSPALPSLLRSKEALLELDTRALFLHLVRLRRAGRSVGEIARLFHLWLTEELADMALAAARRTGVRTVALGGGVLHNATLARRIPLALRERGLVPLMHRALPPGDGGLCLGQADWARRSLCD